MLKSKFLKAVTAAICIVTLILPNTSVVLAAALTNENPNETNKVKLISSAFHEGGKESTESLSDELNENYDAHQYKYTFGGTGKTDILKVLREDDKNSSGAYQFSDAFYCLDGNNSFPSLNGSIEYTRTIVDFFAENPGTLNLSDSNYNSLCWLLNNMYLRKQMTATQRAAQKDTIIKNAFADLINSEYEDAPTVDEIKSIITDDDIEVVQQWAIWYFTNNGENTLQGIPFTNSNKTLPTIDITDITGNTDSMPNTPGNMRYDWATILYQYFVNSAISNKSVVTTSSKYPTIANKDITCEIDGENYKVGPFKVTAPSSDLSASDYQITLTDGTSELLSTAYTIKDKDGKQLSDKINSIFDTEYYIYLPIKGNKISNIKLNLSYTKFGTKASVWQADDNTYQPLVLITKEGDTKNDEVTVAITDVNYDLALRKYIISVNGNEITDRTPDVDTSKLVDGTSKTAEYKHKKDAVKVKVGDTVTYRIAVFNEGDTVAQASEIVDYLPTGLKFIEDNETNKNYKWVLSADGKTVTTTVTNGLDIPALNKSNGNITQAYVDIVCEVTSDAVSGAKLTNIAEIKSDNIEDRDSTPDSLSTKIDSIDRGTYIGTSGKTDLTDSTYYYKGYEDDDDFETVVVDGKAFDLSLQKFITQINGKDVKSREPVVDTTSLKNGSTNATYKTVKTPELVQAGDIVKYTIRVYNEGELDGYAESVADYLPDGLGYLVNYNDNINNYWAINKGTEAELKTIKLSEIEGGSKNLKLEDFTGVTDLNNVEVVVGNVWESDGSRDKNSCMSLTTTALSSKNSDNLIKAFDGSDKLSYKDVEVTCIVLGSSSELTNYSEIIQDLDEDKNEVTDRDSTPDNNRPWDTKDGKPENSNDDDWDYEPLTMQKFDLALQKFITGLNDKQITDRVPTVSYTDGKISYKHPDTALEVNNGDTVKYTIRVYNEGELDGYAAEIGDDIPNGLVFDSENETNKKYGWKMIDASGNETADSSKAVEIRTDYLSKEKSEARKESALLKAFNSGSGDLFYLDVEAVFKVSTKSADNTIINTAEITKDTDSDGNEVDDIDSTPDNKKEDEDDIDKEKIHVGYFDLALKKDLVKAIVTEGGKTTETNAVDGQLMKVEIHRKKINSTIVKFVYNISITNEGTIPGYAKEIKDYIPKGLQFVAEDNSSWTASSDEVITSNALENTLLQPGETKTVEVTLRWINGEDNLGLKTNVAEISKDYNDANDVDDIDSTPDNKLEGEDDIDDAEVILSISTGRAPVYIVLTTTILGIISTGVVMIKKYVLK